MNELAVMQNIVFGCRDGLTGLFFTVSMLGSGALMYMDVEKTLELIKSEQIADIHQLEGKSCVVRVDRKADTVKFVRLHKEVE